MTAALAMPAVTDERAGFEALCHETRRAALSVAFGVLGCPEAAGDAVQEAHLRAWRARHQLRDPAAARAWLLATVRHAAVDVARRKTPKPPPADHAPPADEAAAAAERSRRLADALARLDPDTREALAMRYFDHAPSRQIAERQGVSVAAVDKRVSRGKARLRELLEGVDL